MNNDEKKEKRIREEVIPDYSEDEMVVPVYEDPDTLESAPIPSYPAKKEKKEDKQEGKKEVEKKSRVEKNKNIQIEEEKNRKPQYSIKSKQKRYGKLCMIISLLFIPGLISALIVASHSNALVTSFLENVAIVTLGLCIGLFLVGIYLYIRRRKARTIRPKKLWAKCLYTVFMGCYVTGCVVVLTLLYGPNTSFKDWLVTTAMATMNHEYYCKWFYSEAEIEEVFSRNYIKERDESTNPDLIEIEEKEEKQEEEKPVYENEYEEAVLTHNPEDIYKIIRFQVNGCNAYLGVIYDPSKVKVVTTKYLGSKGQYLTDMVKDKDALIAINGSGFGDPGHSSTGGQPLGITIADGKIITNNEYGSKGIGGIIGFTRENKLVLLKNTTAKEAIEMGVRDAVSWGPFLIVNGKLAYAKGNGGWGGAARTAIGQRADGIVLFLVVDSNAARTKGANMVEMMEIMDRYGAVNAANLDGGTSSNFVENGKLINDPIDGDLLHKTRWIATGFMVTK